MQRLESVQGAVAVGVMAKKMDVAAVVWNNINITNNKGGSFSHPKK